MSEHPSPNVEKALTVLESDQKELVDLAAKMVRAYDGAVYPFDLFANSAVNRSLALSSGFCTLIRDRNLICAGALLRLQLDTAIRFFAGFIVENPHDFAQAVLDGKQIRKLKDQGGKPMSDRHLLSILAKEFPWIEPVYEKTSDYVHLSGTHISSTFDELSKENGSFKIKIGAVDKELPEDVYLEAITVFQQSMLIFVRYLNGWIYTKNNPEIVAQMKAKRGRASSAT